MAKLLKFPKDFYWGASTSAHQVEGGNKNDWTEWEKENTEALAKNAHDHLQLWQLELFPEALKLKNYISGKAVDHYNRYEEDFDVAKSLGMNAQRISIEWSRIEPKEGKFDEKEIEHYRNVIFALHDRGIEPIVGLWHWTNPLWFRDMGGWANRKAPHYFARYAAKLANELGGNVKYWITLNEPLVYAGHGYLNGDWPPQKRNIFLYLKVLHHLESAHRRGSNAIRIIDRESLIGLAKHNIFFDSTGGSTNRILKRLGDWWWNRHFLNNVKKHVDFIGLNNYFRSVVRYGFGKNVTDEVSDLDWELYPYSVYETLKGLKRYRKPVIVTESGLADAKDDRRANYIQEVLTGVHKAINEGVDVRGYLHWSLLDNFEWDKGFWPRFGLVEVDYKDGLKRKVRGSAKDYSKIIKANAVEALE